MDETVTQQSWFDALEARRDAGLSVEPTPVAEIPYGTIVCYWDDTLGLRSPKHEVIINGPSAWPAAWDSKVAGWPQRGLLLGTGPARATNDGLNTIDLPDGRLFYYGIVPTTTTSVNFDDGTILPVDKLCAGKQ